MKYLVSERFDMNKLAKDQLVQCLIDLAARFDELGDKNTQAILLVVAGTIKEGSQEFLAMWMAEYAKVRIAMIQNKLEDDEDDDL
jgi:hypothetical protein